MKSVPASERWFSFAGHRNTEFDLRMLSMPTRQHPARNGEAISIPGRNGRLYQDDGSYDQILITLSVIAVGDNFDAIGAWLTGSGDLIFGDDATKKYKATITKSMSITNRNPRLSGRQFTITFDCYPLKYLAAAETPTTLTDTGSVTNSGTIYSEPRITITGTGDYLLTVNGYLIEGLDIVETAIVDCELMEVFKSDGLTSYNASFSIDEFPTLDPGLNVVSWTGSITSVVIDPRSRFI